MRFDGENFCASNSVLRNKLKELTRARAFGCPNREENPAQSMMMFSLGIATAFIGIMLA